jgi:hypothetical protein
MRSGLGRSAHALIESVGLNAIAVDRYGLEVYHESGAGVRQKQGRELSQ